MTHEAFLFAWNQALRRSELPRAGFATTTLDLEHLDRVSEVRVAPLGGQFAAPFHVTAGLSFRWSALLTARAATIEEDVLVELLGRPEAGDRDTEQPWVRVDISLCATLPHGKPLPMPAPDRWASWAREATTRLGELEPVVVDEEDSDPESDMFTIGAWQGSPSATFRCEEDGRLALERIELEAWQAIGVPRNCADGRKGTIGGQALSRSGDDARWLRLTDRVPRPAAPWKMGRSGSRARRVARRPAGSDAGSRAQRTSRLVRGARPPGRGSPRLT
ncbi:MAG: hypothetical protein R3F59_35175 [Myxococcota bacterium]